MRIQPQAITHILAAAFVAVIGLCLWQSWNNFWTVTEWSQVQ